MNIGEKLEHIDQSDLSEDYRAKILEIIRELKYNQASLADQTNLLQGIIPFRCEPGVISYLFTGEDSIHSGSTSSGMEDPAFISHFLGIGPGVDGCLRPNMELFYCLRNNRLRRLQQEVAKFV